MAEAPSTAAAGRPRGPDLDDVPSRMRTTLASAAWIASVVCALLLAVGALLVALRIDQGNAVVGFVLAGAESVDLGVLKQFDGKDAAAKSALTSWGTAAVAYLAIGKLLDSLIRP